MLAKILSYGLNGINGYDIEIEADINSGMPSYETVGLPDPSIKESKERIRSAIKNSGFLFPTSRITINLAPADTKKVGSMYDLPIAISLLAASEQIDYKKVKGYIMLGELALDGRVRRVNGILPALISILDKYGKGTKVIIPKENGKEGSFIEGLDVFAVKSLREAASFLSGEVTLESVANQRIDALLSMGTPKGDFCHIKGQFRAKRAAEIAAAGGHNIIMIGAPGAGKTMLAKALPGILPDLTVGECLETTKIHSVAGKLDRDVGLVTARPFRTPHHTTTTIALAGGGNSAKPGEISLAHNGILYLDEMPEYKVQTLEVLRQPLEDGVITIARANRSVEYPARFMLVASLNPCPCGYYGSETGNCRCSPAQIHKYLSKLSGPLMDRIDLHIEVDAIKYDDLTDKVLAEPSSAIKERVNRAREIQTKRFEGTDAHSNAQMSTEQVNEYCVLSEEGENLLKIAFDTLKLSARAHNRILKVARTIADLADSPNITSAHLAEAVSYRALDKRFQV